MKPANTYSLPKQLLSAVTGGVCAVASNVVGSGAAERCVAESGINTSSICLDSSLLAVVKGASETEPGT